MTKDEIKRIKEEILILECSDDLAYLNLATRSQIDALNNRLIKERDNEVGSKAIR